MFKSKKAMASLGLAVMIALQAGAVASAKSDSGDKKAEFKAPKLALKVDRYDKDGLPRNFRTSMDKLKLKQVRDGVLPTDKGMSDLNVSASSCFSEKELENILMAVPVNADKFYDIDLRQESHGYLDGMAVSWFSYKDWGNDGRSQDIVEHIETDQLNKISKKAKKGEAISVYTFNDNGNKVGPPEDFTVKKVMNEEQMVKKHGANYFRIAIQDHFRPSDADVDKFLDFWKQLPKDAWLHYHCYAGMGRTTIFMLMHDILKSAPKGVSYEDIEKRQGIIGGVYLSDIPDKKKNWERTLYTERYRFTKQFYKYVTEHPNLDVSYTQWAKDHVMEYDEVSYAGYLWRLDTADKDALPRNFRTCKSGYTNEIKEKVAPYFEGGSGKNPTRQGLDTLNISGSAEMSLGEFKQTIAALKKLTNGPIYDVDLRQESHGYFDGNAVSWYGLRDWGNVDKNDDSKAILKDEKDRLAAAQNAKDGVTVAAVVTAKSKYDKVAKDPKVMKVTKAQTEEEVAKELGVNYYRITARDHIWPQPQYIDQFISWYKTLPKDAWLHFHCQAGEGRTTAFMAMVDIMQNPDLDLKEILKRQYLIGGNYVAYKIAKPKSHEYKADFYADKARMVKWFQKYVKANKASNYATPWSKWIKKHDVVK